MIIMKADMCKANPMEKVSIPGKMGLFIKGSSFKDLGRGKGY